MHTLPHSAWGSRSHTHTHKHKHKRAREECNTHSEEQEGEGGGKDSYSDTTFFLPNEGLEKLSRRAWLPNHSSIPTDTKPGRGERERQKRESGARRRNGDWEETAELRDATECGEREREGETERGGRGKKGTAASRAEENGELGKGARDEREDCQRKSKE
ncbi:hypothetical protein NDU88_006662 [Pleurodeles waltl]|uniref:Uncharacterized protein n=1 Tax=Pleurodeles waltl TaxID=8319 RepID=A0AAV7ULP3_PLEWA|nr:hypothetical protein NDU88_006662 [Pleurodeles waltl]